jgi:hypothetical protein
MNKTKTVQQLVDEYRNRQGNPVYEEIGIATEHEGSYSYNNVTNLKLGQDWDEQVFDSTFKGKKRHVKILGKIVRFVESIEE